MSGIALLTYADLDKAHAFARESKDEHVEVAADHPEFYGCITGSGTRRAPLPHLSDREVRSFRDEEDAIIARLDGETDEEDVSDDGDATDADAFDDRDFEFGTSAWDDQEYCQAWQDRIDGITDALDAHRKVPRAPEAQVVRLRETAQFDRFDVAPIEDADDDAVGPSAISGWRASLAGAEDLRLDNGTGGYKGWKDTTKSPTQFMRHAGRVQPTFRRGNGRTAA